jgi:hypothetical protein
MKCARIVRQQCALITAERHIFSSALEQAGKATADATATTPKGTSNNNRLT